MTTLEEFRATVRAFVQSKDGAVKALAREFEVSFSTVDGWWLGTARPHPLMQAQITEFIRKHKPASD